MTSLHRMSPQKVQSTHHTAGLKPNQVGTVILYGIPIVSLVIENIERLCLAQISNTLLKDYSYNEIHNRRVALGITCVQCTPVQLEILRRAGAMPVSSRRCGMITRREAERLCKSFLGDNSPPRLPDDFAFSVHHECAWGCRGAFLPSRYNSSRAKCIKCTFCGLFFSPNKFIFHSHRTSPAASYIQPDAANFNSWRRHMKLSGTPPDEIVHAWEDVKAMFNGGTRKRMMNNSASSISNQMPSCPKLSSASPTPARQVKLQSSTPASIYPVSVVSSQLSNTARVPPFSDLPLPFSMIDYVWHNTDSLKHHFPFSPYGLPWLGSGKRPFLDFVTSSADLGPECDTLLQVQATSNKMYYQSAFRPVYPTLPKNDMNLNKKENLTEKTNLKSVFNSCKTMRPSSRSDSETEKTEVETLRSESCESIRCSQPDTDQVSTPLAASLKKEADEAPCVTSADVTRMLELKSKYWEETTYVEKLLKFREFSPTFLEAITSFKHEQYDMNSRVQSGSTSHVESREKCFRPFATPPERRKSAEDMEADDEVVDIETTEEDTPKDERVMSDPEKHKRSSEGNIWKIAKYSNNDQNDTELSSGGEEENEARKT